MNKTNLAIDIRNLIFYSLMANEFDWHTDVIHKGVIACTLKEIAARLAEQETK